MSRLQRITQLSEPPVIGQFYLVPTVTYTWLNRFEEPRPYPVFPYQHEDAEHLSFPWMHYHVDPRFLDPRIWADAQDSELYSSAKLGDAAAYSMCQRQPLSSGTKALPLPHPPVVWRRRKCQREIGPYQFAKAIAAKLSPAFVGHQCRRVRSGFVCPHKRFPLGSIAPIAGKITCPLHGLQIDAETGVVVGPLQSGAAA